LSESSRQPASVRVVARSGFSNPILHIEELHRVPPLGSQVPPPGAILVFRSRSGRLRAPRRGYTAGEMFWLGPRVCYVIDTTGHVFEAAFELERSSGQRKLRVDVAGTWTVSDPMAVVANRVSDAEDFCLQALSRRVDALLPPEVSMPAVADGLLLDGLKEEILLDCGVRLSGLRAVTGPADEAIDEEAVRFLIAEDEDDDPLDPAGADVGQLVQDAHTVADEALAAFREEHGEAGVGGPVEAALLRFKELVSRIERSLPGENHDAGR
jgi:hypothetical protein